MKIIVAVALMLFTASSYAQWQLLGFLGRSVVRGGATSAVERAAARSAFNKELRSFGAEALGNMGAELVRGANGNLYPRAALENPSADNPQAFTYPCVDYGVFFEQNHQKISMRNVCNFPIQIMGWFVDRTINNQYVYMQCISECKVMQPGEVYTATQQYQQHVGNVTEVVFRY